MELTSKNKQVFTILYAENNVISGVTLKMFLERTGDFEVFLADDGQEAWKLFNKQNFDICLLDIYMPGLDGVSLAGMIRGVNKKVPIMYISGDPSLETKARGYEIGGADDYCVKPIRMDELILRVNALINRSREKTVSSGLIYLGDYIYSARDFLLTYNEVTIYLTIIEVKILNLFIEHVNKTVTRELFISRVWGKEGGRSLDLYISRLRGYFRNSNTVEIVTIPGKGYSLTVPPECFRCL